jgi:hypothetical protein
MRHLSFLALFLITALISCRKNDTQTQPTSKVSPVYNQLRQIGFTDADIKDLGEYYLLDGDLLFKKEGTDTAAMRRYFQKGATLKKPQTEQYVAPGLVSDVNVEAIKLYTSSYDIVNASSPELGDWMRMTSSAAALWANISGTRINYTDQFYYQNTTNSIEIVDDQGILTNSTIAAAEFPHNGTVGFRIFVNLDFLNNWTVPAGVMEYNLVHELGHTLGFWHSNWQTNDGPNTDTHILVPGTPTTDPNSVMNGGTALNTWNGFSSYDQIAARTIYPQGTYYNWLTAPGGTSKFTSYPYYYVTDKSTPIQITWNASLVSTSTVSLELYFDGNYVATIASHIPNSGSYSYPLAQVASHTLEGGFYFMSGFRVRIIADDNGISDYSQIFFISNNEQ